MVFVEEIVDDPPPPTRKRSCVTRSMTASLNEKKSSLSEIPLTKIVKRERTKRSRCNSTNSRKKSKIKKKKTCNSNNEQKIELSELSEEVLIAILEHVSAPGLINMSKTSWLFHRLCHTDTLWRHRCKVCSSL